jgi:hypothetical protein
MPYEDFSKDFGTTAFTLKEVCGLKQKYRASTEATVKRCLGLTTLPRAAVFFHDKGQQFAVKFFWKSDCFRPFIPPGFVPPADSVVHVHSPDEIDRPTPSVPKLEIWVASGRTIRFQVQVIALPQVPQHPEYPKAMALVAQSL